MSKVQKNLKNDMLLLAIIYLVLTGLGVFVMIMSQTFHFLFVRMAIQAIILFFGYVKVKNSEKVAGIIGLVIGILMMITILSGSLIDFLLGLFLFTHSLKYNKQFN